MQLSPSGEELTIEPVNDYFEFDPFSHGRFKVRLQFGVAHEQELWDELSLSFWHEGRVLPGNPPLIFKKAGRS